MDNIQIKFFINYFQPVLKNKDQSATISLLQYHLKCFNTNMQWLIKHWGCKVNFMLWMFCQEIEFDLYLQSLWEGLPLNSRLLIEYTIRKQWSNSGKQTHLRQLSRCRNTFYKIVSLSQSAFQTILARSLSMHLISNWTMSGMFRGKSFGSVALE